MGCSQGTIRDKCKVLLEDHEFDEGHPLVCPKLEGFLAQQDVPKGMFPTGPFQTTGVCAEGRTEDWYCEPKDSRRRTTV